MEYKSVQLSSKKEITQFIKFPWKIYKDSPYWVAPLLVEEYRRLNPDKNHFFKYGSIKLFGVFEYKNKLVGRIAAIYNPKHNNIYKSNDGFFGLFECIDDHKVAELLFNSVKEYFKSQGINKLIGPVSLTTNEETGLLIEGFESTPTFMTNYSKPYYKTLVENIGFTKIQDLFAYQWDLSHQFPGKFFNLIESITKQNKINLRKFDEDKFNEELQIIKHIYNTSFEETWGFIPLDDNEIKEMGEAFKLFADFDLIYLAEYENEPVGFCLTLPDINFVLKKLNGRLLPFGIFKLLYYKNKIISLRLNVLSIMPNHRKKGIAPLLIHNLFNQIKQKKYKNCELSVVMDSNKNMIQLIKNLGFKPSKVYRLYSINI